MLETVREHPIFWTESHGGHWVASSFDAARRVLRDPEHFSTLKHEDGSGGVTIPTAVGPVMLPAEVDGDYHRRLKKILLAKLDKRTVDHMEPRIQAVITEAIDDVLAKGEFDVVHDIADVVPAQVIVTYLGFPEDVRKPFIKAVQDSVSCIPELGDVSPDGPTPEQLAALQTFQGAISTIDELVAARRAEPQGDLVSWMVAPEHGLTDDEVRWMTFTVILGGAENPAALIANTMAVLQEDRELRKRLTDDLSLLPQATEELLRYITAGVSLTRNVIKDVEIAGQQLKAGERILVWLPAANRDPRVFEEPDELDIDRQRRQYIHFGSGAHLCPGSFLVRLQFRLLMEQILTRIPDFEVDLASSRRIEDASIAYLWRDMPATTGR
ncbi:MAG: cytochrome P450 [Solirubrobacteraceae bacterium]